MENTAKKDYIYYDFCANEDFESVKSPAYTLEEFLAMELPEGGRGELIHGHIYMMASPAIRHQRVLRKLIVRFDAFFNGKKCEPFCAPIGVYLNLDKKVYDENWVEPDIIVVCDPDKAKNGKYCDGTPDLMLEILSPSSKFIDSVYKLNMYRAAGVREYWIVDPDNNTVSVYTKNDDEYSATEYCKDDTLKSGIFEGFAVDLAEIFAE